MGAILKGPPKPPKLQPLPPPPAVERMPDEPSPGSRSRTRNAARAAYGRGGTLLTSPLGLTTPVPIVGQKTLLGQ